MTTSVIGESGARAYHEPVVQFYGSDDFDDSDEIAIDKITDVFFKSKAQLEDSKEENVYNILKLSEKVENGEDIGRPMLIDEGDGTYGIWDGHDIVSAYAVAGKSTVPAQVLTEEELNAEAYGAKFKKPKPSAAKGSGFMGKAGLMGLQHTLGRSGEKAAAKKAEEKAEKDRDLSTAQMELELLQQLSAEDKKKPLFHDDLGKFWVVTWPKGPTEDYELGDICWHADIISMMKQSRGGLHWDDLAWVTKSAKKAKDVAKKILDANKRTKYGIAPILAGVGMVSGARAQKKLDKKQEKEDEKARKIQEEDSDLALLQQLSADNYGAEYYSGIIPKVSNILLLSVIGLVGYYYWKKRR